ncbi:hypothetical protein [Fluviispira multicolorata]|uniref:Uncharacterized protein n=1 Tax=Fluviispira multicolorata TaxID=2654512 RepID=A0A833N117_9BACT|nr:hypothetical protein [Fluviispira multicolorata]KAB8029820.1 hypothetical protein GCL57_09785 [Fluviispira multicolorata]
MKNRIFLISIIVVFVALILNNLQNSKQKNTINTSYKEEINQNKNQEIEISNPKTDKIDQKNMSEFSDQELEEVNTFIKNMKDDYTKLQFDSNFRDKVLNAYGQNKNITKIFKKIILENDFAVRLSAEDQAYARVFAIQGLKEIALNHEKEPLISTIQELSLNLQNKETLEKGEQADLEDLLRGYMSVINIDHFTENIEEHLKEIGFTKKIKNQEILDIYDQSLYFSLADKIGRDKAKELLTKFLDS